MAKRKKAEPAQPKKQPRRYRKPKTCWWALPVSCLMILILAATAFLAIHEIGENRRFRIMRDTVESQKFYNGIVVDGYDVSGVTLNEALGFWQNTVEPAHADRTITLVYGDRTWAINACTLGYESNYADVLSGAWTRGRSGTLEQRYRSINQIRNTVERYEVSRSDFNADLLRKWTDNIAKALTVVPQSAAIESFDVKTHEFTFSATSAGYTVDADELFESAYALLSSGGGQMTVNVAEMDPSIVADSVKSKYGMITQAVTNATSSNSNRLTNLRLACEALNGYCVEPGATFSYNEVVGKRTKERGYKLATVYSSGELAEDIGGGVCQVSTTLWNAAMKANCEIVERHEHSRPVSYVDRGKDATVSWGSQDMKFKNTSSSPMYIVAYLSDSKRVYCEIYGELFPDGKYITIEAKTTQKVDPGEPHSTYNPLLEPGTTRTVTEARTGYRASAYRVYWNADGTEIERTLLCTSYYKPARAEIEYG